MARLALTFSAFRSTLRDRLAEHPRSSGVGRASEDWVLRPQPHGPAGTPITITEKQFGRVPRFYVECLRDKTVPPSLQKTMYGEVACQSVFSIDTDHSPFLSTPDELVALLTAVDSKTA